MTAPGSCAPEHQTLLPLSTHSSPSSTALVLAFQADVTRVVTFVLANEGSNRPYPFIEVPEGHHDLSHHGNDAAKKEKIRRINLFHMRQLAYLLEKLNGVQEGDGSLLDHCMLAYGTLNIHHQVLHILRPAYTGYRGFSFSDSTSADTR